MSDNVKAVLIVMMFLAFWALVSIAVHPIAAFFIAAFVTGLVVAFVESILP